MAQTIMHAKDAISASLAECVVEMDGKRYNFMQAIDIEAKMKKTKKKVPILGKTGGGNKATGWEGSGKAKFYYNTSVFRKIAIDYINTGKDIYFDMIIRNEDPTSEVGAQTIILKDCNMDESILAKLKAGDDTLDEDFSFTFEGVEMPEAFANMTGFEL